jgi:hypothetical protein
LGKGKLTGPFSAQSWQISAPRLISAPPRLLALPTEAWRGAEICIHSAENSYVDLPGPDSFCPFQTAADQSSFNYLIKKTLKWSRQRL